MYEQRIITFVMDPQWLSTGHPVGRAIQDLFAAVTFAHAKEFNLKGEGRTAEWSETSKEDA